MQRFTYIIIALLLAITLPTTAKENPFNVDVFFGWDGYYRPSEWTPVNVGVTSDLEEFFKGNVRLSAKQDGLNTMNINHEFVLTPSIPQHLPLVTKFSFNADKCNVTLSNGANRRTVWNHSFDLGDYSKPRKLQPVYENDLLIGLVGGRDFGLIQLPNNTQSVFSGNKSNVAGKGKICIGHKRETMVPWDWTGYSSLDLLILYAPDWSIFKKKQLTAISLWVSKGGKLLLIPGSAPIAEDNPIGGILPYHISDSRETTLTSANLKSLKLNPSGTETIVARPIFTPSTLTDAKSPLYKLASIESEQSLFASANIGFGTVGILALDPKNLSDKQKNNSSLFWVNCITMMLESKTSKFHSDFQPVVVKKDPKQRARSSNRANINNLSMSTIRSIEMKSKIEGNPNNYYNHYFQTGLSQAGSNAVMEYLYNISEMRPLGILPVIFLLLLLAVLVGPVDYIVLKRKGILPMTWVTSAFWIVLFSFGAYHGVQALRGGKLQMRHVTVLDAVEGTGAAWATNYSAVFAPSSDDYELVDERDDQWFSAISPAEQRIRSYNNQSSSKQIHCQQYDGSNIPISMPINIWTMQCLINESPYTQQLPINATCTRNGNKVTVRIDNYSSTELKEGYILFDGNKFLDFSEVPAKGSKEFSGRLQGGKKWDFSIQQIASNQHHNSRNFVARELQTEKVFSAQGCLQRSRSIKNYLSGGAAVVCATFEDAPVPYTLQKKSCEYKHVQLVRLVIFPKQKNKDIAYDQN